MRFQYRSRIARAIYRIKELFLNTLYINEKQALGTDGSNDALIVGSATQPLCIPQLTIMNRGALTPRTGTIIQNATNGRPEYYDGGNWRVIETSDEVEETFTDGDTTPSVTGNTDFVTANTGATTITDFDDEVEGQIIRIRFGDGNTTVRHGTEIFLSGGADKAFAQNQMLVLINRSAKWYQIGGEI